MSKLSFLLMPLLTVLPSARGTASYVVMSPPSSALEGQVSSALRGLTAESCQKEVDSIIGMANRCVKQSNLDGGNCARRLDQQVFRVRASRCFHLSENLKLLSRLLWTDLATDGGTISEDEILQLQEFGRVHGDGVSSLVDKALAKYKVKEAQ